MADEYPRWLTEDYEGADQDIANDIYNAIRAKMVAELQVRGSMATKHREVALTKDQEVMARVTAEAYMAAAAHTDTLRGTMERSFYRLLWKVFHENMHLIGKDEYETVQEFLVNRIPRLSETSGELSDIMFLLEKGLPLLEKVGKDWSPEKLLRMKDKWSKTRAAVPTMRKLFNGYNDSTAVIEDKIKATEKELKTKAFRLEAEDPGTEKYQELYAEVDTISKTTLPDLTKQKEEAIVEAGETFRTEMEKVLQVIDDPRIAPHGEHGVKKALTGIHTPKPISFTGLKANAPGGEIYFLVHVPTRYAMLIESALRTIVDFPVTDPKIMFEEMRSQFFPKQDKEQ